MYISLMFSVCCEPLDQNLDLIADLNPWDLLKGFLGETFSVIGCQVCREETRQCEIIVRYMNCTEGDC